MCAWDRDRESSVPSSAAAVAAVAVAAVAAGRTWRTRGKAVTLRRRSAAMQITNQQLC